MSNVYDDDTDDVETPKMEEIKVTNDVWSQHGDIFMLSSDADKVKTLPPGIYVYGVTMQGWFLKKRSTHFTFPYKVYGQNGMIKNRIKGAWAGLQGNLGILFNGIKGTGKTVTAQDVANWAIEEEKMPVLLVSEPIPNLADVLVGLNQKIMIMFDEFEKTHHKEEWQQNLLSVIDGTAKNEYKRLFIFTTNKTKIDDNFIDRPSRIRYRWEFDNLQEDVIREIIDDMLRPELSELKENLVSYLTNRNIVTIDSVKCAVTETNIFEEIPENFKNILNLSEKEPVSYSIDIIDEAGQSVFSIAKWYRPMPGLDVAFSNPKLVNEQYFKRGRKFLVRDDMNTANLSLIDLGEEPGTYVCEAAIRAKDTWLSKLIDEDRNESIYNVYQDTLVWLQDKPENWDFTMPPKSEAAKRKWREKYTSIIRGINLHKLYGAEQNSIFRIKFTPNKSYSKSYNFGNGKDCAWD